MYGYDGEFYITCIFTTENIFKYRPYRVRVQIVGEFLLQSENTAFGNNGEVVARQTAGNAVIPTGCG